MLGNEKPDDPGVEPKQLIGILLLYYEEYAAESIERFLSFISKVNATTTLIIVQNKVFELPEINHPDLHLIAGDNATREFSGWQTALDYCQAKDIERAQGVFIFANDTFCHHNKFGLLTQFLFARSFRAIFKRPALLKLAGEVHTNKAEYAILDKHFSGWVSTYLFCMTFALTKKTGGVLPKNFPLESFFSGKATIEEFLVGGLSDNLKQHTKKWIFGLTSGAKWYGAAVLNEHNLVAFTGKTKSIICEKYLTANALSVGGTILNSFSSRFLNQVRRIERLFAK